MRSLKNNLCIAFTLAEVLITLGIIGVVASMTIPVLMQNIQDKQFKEATKAAYSKAAQAIEQIKLDNGDSSLDSYITTPNSFKPVFASYFKIAQDCTPSLCVQAQSGAASKTYSTFDKNTYANTGWFADGQFITADGMFWAIYNKNSSGRLFISVDVNGHNKSPNAFGRDTFMFQIKNDKLIPMGSKDSDFSTSVNCKSSGGGQDNGISCTDYVIRGVDY